MILQDQLARDWKRLYDKYLKLTNMAVTQKSLYVGLIRPGGEGLERNYAIQMFATGASPAARLLLKK